MAKRVFELARELGVTSKAVLQKCRAEGLEVKNHMSALSAGLAATISEWFSEEAGGTAVELTEHVDLEAEHKRAAAQRRRRTKAEAAGEPAEAAPVEQAVAVAEAPPEQAVAEAPAEVVAEAAAPAAETIAPAPEADVVAEAVAPAEEATAPAEAVAAEPAEAEAPPEEEAPPAEVEEAVPELPKAVPNEPVKPEILGPAGPQVVPTPAKMQGPRVVRFDGVEPEVAAPRRPRGGILSRRPPMIGGPDTVGPDSGSGPGVGRKGAAKAGDRKTTRTKRRSPRRKSGRTAETGEGIREWRDRDLAERSQRLAAATGGTLRRHRASVGPSKGQPVMPTGAVEIDEPITIKGLSAATGIRINEMIRRLMGQGVLATINSALDRETAEALALDHGLELKIKAAVTAESLLEEKLTRKEAGEQTPRPPIVTFLGHVDHGKTSLLDHIRNAAVASGEEGGITQHIGSYRYDVGEQHVVFLDTPGHEAFTEMRARGANMTDVVVLVVAADDGVMPQTVEAINHAKAAGVPIVVALNKIDLPNANVQRALGQLAEHELHPREWGGQTEVIHTSAETGEGVDHLVEILSLEAELLELKADPAGVAGGFVVEARRDSSRGVLATLLVRDGTLKVADLVLCGRAYGKIRNMTDDRGRQIQEAPPATPVVISGLGDVPDAGDKFHVLDDLALAKEVAEDRRSRERSEALTAAPTRSLENIFERIEAGETGELRLIVKADVQGSLEALLGSLAKQQNEEVRSVVLHSGVGGITEGDVLLAEASEAIILGFCVVPDHRARRLAEQKGVDVRTYRVIYQLLEDVQKAVVGMLAAEFVEEVTGRAEVRETFKISRLGTIAGCSVLDGVISRNAKVRLIRDNVVIKEGRELDSLRRFKDDVREVRAGLECGIKLAGYDDIKNGDVIEAYQTVEVARQA